MARMVDIPEPVAEWETPIVGSLTGRQLITFLGISGIFEII